MWSSELFFVYPEVVLTTFASFILLLDLWLSPKSKWIIYTLSQLALMATMYCLIQLIAFTPTIVFNGAIILDSISLSLKLIICLFGSFVFIYTRKYLFDRQEFKAEYFILCLFSILGMMILVSSYNFLSLYLGIELLALPLYALITMLQGNKLATEAAMKYFIMGALASGMLLYGISLLYGVTGSLSLIAVAEHLSISSAAPSLTLMFGLIFVFVSLAFKFGAVPFHMWLPDVYQGSPIIMTLFIGTLPKLAAFGFAIRMLNDTFPSLHFHWQPLLITMGILSLIIGNVVAIAQSNLKRMLAYSTIAHMGFLFLGLSLGSEAGFIAAYNYILIYALMALGGFGVMTLLSCESIEAENIQDFQGLSSQHPWFAFLMMLILLSLAGIPPFSGFYAKFFIIKELIDSGYLGLALFAVLMTVIGAYYYLRIIRVMFFDAPQGSKIQTSLASPEAIVLTLNGFLLLILGIFPAALYQFCQVLVLTAF